VVFILCIVLHPKVQQRVHEELDREIGHERLPTLEDLSSLVYLQAAWKECLRWHPITPLGARAHIFARPFR
jgi:cytochrome P450